jgi:hypothetical protein
MFSSTRRSDSRNSTATAVRSRLAFRPRLEALEDRANPSAFVVDKLSPDEVTVPGTLRYAIYWADYTHNVDGQFTSTITFKSDLNGVLGITSELPPLNANITITGPGASAVWIEPLRSDGPPAPYRILTVNANWFCSISGLTMSGGYLPGGNGGAILNKGVLTLDQVYLSGNEAANGGAVANIYNLTDANRASLTMTGCIVSGNTARGGNGGGIYNESGSLSINNCSIGGNSALFTSAGGDGGGVWSGGGTLNVTNGSAILGNDADGDGGGIWTSNTCIVSGSTIQNNTAGGGLGDGGGIYSTANVKLTDCTFGGNKALQGTGVYVVGSGGLYSCTQFNVTWNGDDVDGTP